MDHIAFAPQPLPSITTRARAIQRNLGLIPAAGYLRNRHVSLDTALAVLLGTRERFKHLAPADLRVVASSPLLGASFPADLPHELRMLGLI